MKTTAGGANKQKFSRALNDLPWSECNYIIAQMDFRFLLVYKAVLTATVITGFTLLSHASGRLEVWRVRNQEPLVLRDVVFAKDKFFAVGSGVIGGVVTYSTDGSSWRTVQPGVGPELLRIIYTNGIFVALGSYPIDTTGGYVLSGTGNILSILSSEDGETWKERINKTYKIPFDGGFTGLAYFNGQFIALDRSGSLYRSQNGINWIVEPGIPNARFLFHDNDRLIAVSTQRTFHSTNGTIWMEQPQITTGQINLGPIAYGNGRYILSTGSSNWLSSVDGSNWQPFPIPVWQGSFNDLSYFNGSFWAPFQDYSYSLGLYPAGAIWRSSTGTNWVKNEQLLSAPLQAVTYHNGRMIAVGELGFSANSKDGTNWTEVYLPASGNTYGIAYGEGRYVAVGASNPYYRSREPASEKSKAQVLLSTNGSDWSYSLIPNVKGESLSVCYGNGTFAAVGNGWIATSQNGGTSWSVSTNSADLSFQSIAFGGGHFTAVGDKGLILTSTDGISWTRQAIATNIFLTKIIYGNGTFVSTGVIPWSPDPPYYGGYWFILTSANGSNWTTRSSNWTIGDIAYGAGRFLAMPVSSGTPIVSTDGINWSEAGKLNSHHPSIIYGGGAFLVTSSTGSIWASVDGYDWKFLTYKFGLQPYHGVFAQNRFTLIGAAASVIQTDPIDPLAQVNISVSSSRISELETQGASIILTRSADIFDSQKIVVHLSFGGSATEGIDYQTAAHTVEIPAGQHQVEIPILLLRDDVKESDETIEISLLPAIGYNIGATNVATITLEDAPDAPRFKQKGIKPQYDGSLRLSLDSPKNAVIQIESSEDLKFWELWQTITNLTGSMDLLDRRYTNSMHRFYRATTIPGE